MLSSRILTILSAVALICIIALITLQILEASYFNEAPSLWPG